MLEVAIVGCVGDGCRGELGTEIGAVGWGGGSMGGLEVVEILSGGWVGRN